MKQWWQINNPMVIYVNFIFQTRELEALVKRLRSSTKVSLMMVILSFWCYRDRMILNLHLFKCDISLILGRKDRLFSKNTRVAEAAGNGQRRG